MAKNTVAGSDDWLVNGGLVWAKVPSYPPWPSIILVDPDSNMWQRNGNKNQLEVYILFLEWWDQDNLTDCWMKASKLNEYKGEANEGGKKPRKKDEADFRKAIKFADQLMELSLVERKKAVEVKYDIAPHSNSCSNGSVEVKCDIATGTNSYFDESVEVKYDGGPDTSSYSNGSVEGKYDGAPDTNSYLNESVEVEYDVAHDTNDLNSYINGSLVLATVPSYPAWPSIISQDPDSGMWWRNTDENVESCEVYVCFLEWLFRGQVSYEWMKPSKLRQYRVAERDNCLNKARKRDRNALMKAFDFAETLEVVSNEDRLKIFFEKYGSNPADDSQTKKEKMDKSNMRVQQTDETKIIFQKGTVCNEVTSRGKKRKKAKVDQNKLKDKECHSKEIALCKMSNQETDYRKISRKKTVCNEVMARGKIYKKCKVDLVKLTVDATNSKQMVKVHDKRIQVLRKENGVTETYKKPKKSKEDQDELQVDMYHMDEMEKSNMSNQPNDNRENNLWNETVYNEVKESDSKRKKCKLDQDEVREEGCHLKEMEKCKLDNQLSDHRKRVLRQENVYNEITGRSKKRTKGKVDQDELLKTVNENKKLPMKKRPYKQPDWPEQILQEYFEMQNSAIENILNKQNRDQEIPVDLISQKQSVEQILFRNEAIKNNSSPQKQQKHEQPEQSEQDQNQRGIEKPHKLNKGWEQPEEKLKQTETTPHMKGNIEQEEPICMVGQITPVGDHEQQNKVFRIRNSLKKQQPCPQLKQDQETQDQQQKQKEHLHQLEKSSEQSYQQEKEHRIPTSRISTKTENNLCVEINKEEEPIFMVGRRKSVEKGRQRNEIQNRYLADRQQQEKQDQKQIKKEQSEHLNKNKEHQEFNPSFRKTEDILNMKCKIQQKEHICLTGPRNSLEEIELRKEMRENTNIPDRQQSYSHQQMQWQHLEEDGQEMPPEQPPQHFRNVLVGQKKSVESSDESRQHNKIDENRAFIDKQQQTQCQQDENRAFIGKHQHMQCQQKEDGKKTQEIQNQISSGLVEEDLEIPHSPEHQDLSSLSIKTASGMGNSIDKKEPKYLNNEIENIRQIKVSEEERGKKQQEIQKGQPSQKLYTNLKEPHSNDQQEPTASTSMTENNLHMERNSEQNQHYLQHQTYCQEQELQASEQQQTQVDMVSEVSHQKDQDALDLLPMLTEQIPYIESSIELNSHDSMTEQRKIRNDVKMLFEKHHLLTQIPNQWNQQEPPQHQSDCVYELHQQEMQGIYPSLNKTDISPYLQIYNEQPYQESYIEQSNMEYYVEQPYTQSYVEHPNTSRNLTISENNSNNMNIQGNKAATEIYVIDRDDTGLREELGHNHSDSNDSKEQFPEEFVWEGNGNSIPELKTIKKRKKNRKGTEKATKGKTSKINFNAPSIVVNENQMVVDRQQWCPFQRQEWQVQKHGGQDQHQLRLVKVQEHSQLPQYPQLQQQEDYLLVSTQHIYNIENKISTGEIPVLNNLNQSLYNPDQNLQQKFVNSPKDRPKATSTAVSNHNSSSNMNVQGLGTATESYVADIEDMDVREEIVHESPLDLVMDEKEVTPAHQDYSQEKETAEPSFKNDLSYNTTVENDLEEVLACVGSVPGIESNVHIASLHDTDLFVTNGDILSASDLLDVVLKEIDSTILLIDGEIYIATLDHDYCQSRRNSSDSTQKIMETPLGTPTASSENKEVPSEIVMFAKAVVAYRTGNYKELCSIIEGWKFPLRYHAELQGMWYKAHYNLREMVTQTKPLCEAEKYRLRRKYPPPMTINAALESGESSES